LIAFGSLPHLNLIRAVLAVLVQYRYRMSLFHKVSSLKMQSRHSEGFAMSDNIGPPYDIQPVDVGSELLDSPYMNTGNVPIIDPPDLPFFIEVVPHPDSGTRTPTIISLDHANVTSKADSSARNINPSDLPPWAPFKSRADFEFTEIAVKSGTPKDLVNFHLRCLHHSWTDSTRVTFKTYADMSESLAAAREFGIQVCFRLSGSIIVI
jgi:hypothetical protein